MMTLTRRARVGVLATAAVLALGACSHPSAATAYEVEGATVSMQQLEDWNRACTAASAAATPQARVEGVRNMALQGLLGQKLRQELSITVDDQQARQAVVDSGAGAALADPGCASLMMDYGRFFLTLKQLQPEQALKAVQGLDITVNPRIGVWDTKNLELVHTSGTLSQIAPVTTDSGR